MMVLEQQYSYEEIFHTMKSLSEENSDFCSFEIIGESLDQRPIPMLRLGLGKHVLFCTAGIHGREFVNPILLLKIVSDYCRAYRLREKISGIYDTYQLLNQYTICMIPLVNPDGFEIVMNGFSAIENPILRQAARMKGILPRNWKYNARGVDINRNFPSKSYIQQQPFEYPASEPETQAIIQVFLRYSSVAYLDFHSRGKIIYYYRQAMPVTYNQKSQKLALYMQKLSHYNLGKKEEEFMSRLCGGNSVNYYSEIIKKPALTIETLEDTFTPKSAYEAEAYKEIFAIPIGILDVIQ